MARENLTEKVHETINAHPDGLTLQQIAGEVGGSQTQVGKRIYNLVATKRVVQHPPGVPRGEAMFYPMGHGPTAEGVEKGGGPAATTKDETPKEVERTPLSGDQERLLRFLDDLGVKAGPARTIAETFFWTGEQEDMKRLYSLLTDAKAYVTSGQRRMIMRVWSDYTDTSIPEEIARLIDQARSEEGAAGAEDAVDEFDLGWRVEKDDTGEWVPVAGGEIKTHMQALRAAAAMNAASGKGRRGEGDGGGSRGAIDPTVQVLIDRAFPEEGRSGGKDTLDQVLAIVDRVVPKRGEGEESEVQTLRRQLQEEREKARDKEVGELKNLVAASLNRDPVKDYIEMQQRIEALRGSPVTDNSPTVQVIKDQTDKLERLGVRGLGLVERVVLRNQPLEPEEGSEVEQEQRAERLANRLEGDARQRQLRREVYGIG